MRMKREIEYEVTARRLAYALQRSGLSQQQLADKSGVSKNSISQYMNRKNAPSNISASKLGSVLNVNPMWLMGYNIDMDSKMNHDEYVKYEEKFQESFLKAIEKANRDFEIDHGPAIEEESEEDKIIKAYILADEITKKHVRLLLGIDN